jgi:hypothetical protein
MASLSSRIRTKLPLNELGGVVISEYAKLRAAKRVVLILGPRLAQRASVYDAGKAVLVPLVCCRVVLRTSRDSAGFRCPAAIWVGGRVGKVAS